VERRGGGFIWVYWESVSKRATISQATSNFYSDDLPWKPDLQKGRFGGEEGELSTPIG